MELNKNPASSIRVLYAFNFLKSLQFFGALAVPFFLLRAGLSYTRMFTLEAVFSFFLFAFEIPTGVVADHMGRKISLFWGALAFGLGFTIFGFTVSFPFLIAAEIISAFGMSMLSGADRALLYELVIESGREADCTAINSRYDAFGTAGMFVAFPIGTLFAASGLVSYRTALGAVFVATGIMLILAGFLVLFAHESERVKTEGSAIRSGIEGFKYIFKVPALTRFSLNYAVISALTFFMYWFYQSLLMKNNFPIRFQGFIPAGFNAGAMLLLLGAAFIQKKIGTRNVLLISSIVPAFLYLGVFFVPGLPMALCAIFGITMLKSFRSPMLNTLMNGYIESANRATVLSGVSMLERVITTLFYPFVGMLTDISLEWTFLLMGTVTLFASLFFRVSETK